jgi:hypothetical protein
MPRASLCRALGSRCSTPKAAPSFAGRVTIDQKTARALQSPAIVPPRALRQAFVLE